MGNEWPEEILSELQKSVNTREVKIQTSPLRINSFFYLL